MANEKRLIDANDALEVLCNYCGVEGCCPEGGCAEYQKISKIPTVDAVEVVRCKDCRKCHPWEAPNGATGYECDYHGEDVKLDDFCSYGERREGE